MTNDTGYVYSFDRNELDPGREWVSTEQEAFQKAFDAFYEGCANGEEFNHPQSCAVFLSRMCDTFTGPVVLSTKIHEVYYCPQRSDRAEHFSQRDYI